MPTVLTRTRTRWIIAAGVVLALIGAGFVGYRVYKDESTRAASCAVVEDETRRLADEKAALVPAQANVVVIGDSFSQGVFLPDAVDAWPYQVLGTNGVLVDGIGGTGFLADGPCGDNDFGTRLDAALALHPETLVIQGGVNDIAAPGDLAASIDGILERASDVPRVIVVGPFAPPRFTAVELDPVSATLAASASEHGATFIDARDIEFDVLDDQVHPSESGSAQIASALRGLLPVD